MRCLLCLLVILASGCPEETSSNPDLGPTVDQLSMVDTAIDLTAAVDLPPDQPPPPDIWTWPDLATDRPHKEIEHLTDDALKAALLKLVQNHTQLGYDGAKDAIFTTAGGGLDVIGGEIECIYTGAKVQPNGTTAPGGFNTEHSWPKSEGADKEPGKSDLNHLFPCDASANSYRGSLPFGETNCGASGSCNWNIGGSEIGPVIGGSAKVFEVRLERRGDIARAHFYFSVRYALPIPASEEKWLKVWNYNDPPDARERQRAAGIEALQKKRNPFVDRHDFVNAISDF